MSLETTEHDGVIAACIAAVPHELEPSARQTVHPDNFTRFGSVHSHITASRTALAVSLMECNDCIILSSTWIDESSARAV